MRKSRHSNLESFELSGPLAGVELVSLGAGDGVRWTQDDAKWKHTKNAVSRLFVDLFFAPYKKNFHVFDGYYDSPDALKSDLEKDCQDDFRLLENQTPEEKFYFLIARDKRTAEPLGLATLEVSGTTAYLSNIAAHYYQTPENRGIARQLLGFFFQLEPEIETVNLIVIPGIESPVKIYEKWGFKRTDFSHTAFTQGPYWGMTLSGSALADFKLSFKQNR